MKQVIFCMAVICLLGAGCKNGNRIVVNNNDHYLEIDYDGEIKFTEDETAIESMSPGSYLEFTTNDRRLIAKRSYHGEVKYQLYEYGRRVDPYGEKGQRLIGDIVQEMVKLGFNVDEKMRRVYERGGELALLKATLAAEGDYLKGRYLAYLLSGSEPDVDELTAAAVIVAVDMKGDFEKAQVLKAFPNNSLADQRIATQWLKAVVTIHSNFEKTQTLRTFPLNEIDNPSIIVEWIEVAKTLDADFEKSQVLKEFPVDKLNDSLVSTAWFAAISSIGADFEKANTLKMITAQPLSKVQFNSALVTVAGINAEFEQVNIIKELIHQQVPSEPKSFEQLMTLIGNINTDFEKSNILKSIIEKGIETESQWSGIIRETRGVTADFEKTNILLLVAAKMPKTETLKLSYLDAAKEISSEMDYGKLVRAVE